MKLAAQVVGFSLCLLLLACGGGSDGSSSENSATESTDNSSSGSTNNTGSDTNSDDSVADSSNNNDSNPDPDNTQTLASRLITEGSENAWNCSSPEIGTRIYKFNRDGTGEEFIAADATTTPIRYEVTDAGSVTATIDNPSNTTIASFFWQRVVFDDTGISFTAVNGLSVDSDQISCNRLVDSRPTSAEIENLKSMLITGTSESDIGSASWQCTASTFPSDGVAHLLFFENGTGLSAIRTSTDVDGDEFNWSVDAATGAVIADGDELENLEITNDQFTTILEGALLSCERQQELPLVTLLVTGPTAESSTESWNCTTTTGENFAYQFGLDFTADVTVPPATVNSTSWSIARPDGQPVIQFADTITPLSDIVFGSVNDFDAVLPQFSLSIGCNRS